jgi:hypothetical protein
VGGGFDTLGNDYSAQALTTAGFTSGGVVTAGGMTFNLPPVSLGSPDNLVATGQSIALPAVPGATTLGFLGAASARPLTGTVTIAYTDGTSTTTTMDFDDWALNGSAPPAKPFPDNSIVATMPYRDTASGAQQNVPVYVFFTSVALDPTKTATSVTLPAAAPDIPELHIFAMTVGSPSSTGTPTGTPVTGSPTSTAVPSGTSTPVTGSPTSTAVASGTSTPATGSPTSTAVPSSTSTTTP